MGGDPDLFNLLIFLGYLDVFVLSGDFEGFFLFDLGFFDSLCFIYLRLLDSFVCDDLGFFGLFAPTFGFFCS